MSELYDALLGVSPATAHRATPARGRRAWPPLGLRVLVVEDNQVNQMVATGLLESLGCTRRLAVDGHEAVDAARRSARTPGPDGLPDARLDGFDATRAIRPRSPTGDARAIIAMTASALEGERERCIAAGMDDFLTKPVDAPPG